MAVPVATGGRRQAHSGGPSSGRAQRRNTPTGRARTPNLDRLYRYKMDPITPGEFNFELSLIRGRRVKPLPLGTVCEEFGWTDEQATLTGDAVLRRPEALDPSSLPVGRGHLLRCRVRHGSSWFELWRMRVQGEPEVSLADGTITVQLADDLALLDRDRRDWLFRKDKRHPHGWTADQIARHVARVTGLKLGRIAKGKHRITKLRKRNASPLDVLRAAYAEETDATARRFVIRFRNARLEVVPYARNRVLYVFGKRLEEATISKTGKARPFTVIEGKARLGKGKDAKHITYTYRSAKIVRRFGRVKQEKNYGRVESRAELRRKVKRDYAKGLKTKLSASISMPGIPWIRRGEGCQLNLPREGFKGARAFVFTTRVAQRVSASSGYTMECDLSSTDPFEKDRERRERELRAKKRKARKRKRR